MWAYLSHPSPMDREPRRVPRRVRLPRGCRATLFELFAGSIVFTAAMCAHFALLGHVVSEPMEVASDGTDLATPSGRAIADRVTERGDPYLTTFTFADDAHGREAAKPMLDWIVRKARVRTEKAGWP